MRVSQEAIHLTFKGVGLVVPAFMAGAFKRVAGIPMMSKQAALTWMEGLLP